MLWQSNTLPKETNLTRVRLTAPEYISWVIVCFFASFNSYSEVIWKGIFIGFSALWKNYSRFCSVKIDTLLSNTPIKIEMPPVSESPKNTIIISLKKNVDVIRIIVFYIRFMGFFTDQMMSRGESTGSSLYIIIHKNTVYVPGNVLCIMSTS